MIIPPTSGYLFINGALCCTQILIFFKEGGRGEERERALARVGGEEQRVRESLKQDPPQRRDRSGA